jgi:cell division protein FtsL
MSARGLSIALLLLGVVASAIGVVYARHRHRQAFIALSALESARDELNIEFGRLQLEQATWAETNRIDQIARNQLGMKFPEGADVVVIRP